MRIRNIIRNLFNKKEDNTLKVLLEIQAELVKDNAFYEVQQKAEDFRVETCAMMEAHDMYFNYENNRIKALIWDNTHPEVNKLLNPYKMSFYIPRPQVSILYEYPGQKAKYNSKTYKEKVLEEFNRLKNDDKLTNI